MIILNIICNVNKPNSSQGSFRVCKNHNVILLILLTLLEKLAKISPGLEPRCAMCTLRLCLLMQLITEEIFVLKANEYVEQFFRYARNNNNRLDKILLITL